MTSIAKIIVSMKKKIPILPLTIQLVITNSVYNNKNNVELSYSTYLIGFWIYFPLLCLITCIWESFHAYTEYKNKYPQRTHKERVCYTILSTFISLWVFIATSYYINDGIPFSILFEYNTIIANITFYMSYALVSLITYLEHYKWPKLIPLPELYNNNEAFSIH